MWGRGDMRGSGGILYSGPEEKLNKQTSTERLLKKDIFKDSIKLILGRLKVKLSR